MPVHRSPLRNAPSAARRSRVRVLSCAAAIALAAGLAATSRGQGPPPTPVGFTEAISREVRGSLTLSGTVESQRYAVVAAEVDGLVVALDVGVGDSLREDQPLARLRKTTYEIALRAAESQLREARARLELAERQLERARDLFADRVISQDDLDNASSEFTAWQARVDQSLAEIDRNQVALDRCTIRAPFTGVVTAERTEIGEWMQRGGAVVEMVALDDLEVRVEVPETWYRNLKLGLTAVVTFQALPDLRVAGRVREVSPSADRLARTFPAKVAIDNAGRRIGTGMLARVALPVGDLVRGTLVPKDALIRRGPNREVVFRIGDDGNVEEVEVVPVQGQGAWQVVEGSLAPGDRVVTRGNERIRPGQAVEATPQEYAAP